MDNTIMDEYQHLFTRTGHIYGYLGKGEFFENIKLRAPAGTYYSFEVEDKVYQTLNYNLDHQLVYFWNELLDNKNFKYTLTAVLRNQHSNYTIPVGCTLYYDFILDVFLKKDFVIDNAFKKSKVLTYYLTKKTPNSYFDPKKYLASHINKDNTEPLIEPNLKVKLFPYQLKTINLMKKIESSGFQINLTKEHKISNESFHVDTFTQSLVPATILAHVTTSGGILADEMGLGKTITTLALTELNKINNIDINNSIITIDSRNYLRSRASLIIVPSHLGPQWESEINKVIPGNPKIITLFTSTNHKKVTFKDIINADYIIVSQQFLCNFKHYLNCHYNKVKLSGSTYDHENRISHILTSIEAWKKVNLDTFLNTNYPILEVFFFNRIILDEGHEIMERNFGSSVIQCKVFINLLSELKGNNKWYLSGTPFTTKDGINNILNLLNIKLTTNIIVKKKYDRWTIKDNNYLAIEDINIIKQITTNIMLRNTRDNVEKEVNFKGYEENVHWINQTNMEKQIYNGLKNEKTKEFLVQLCCHFLVASANEIVGNELDLDKVQENLIQYHTKTLETYKDKLSKLDPENQAYHMHKKTYTDKISQSTFMLDVLKKLDDDKELELDNSCAICFGDMEQASITKCGHIFCTSCLHASIKLANCCPMCKTALGSDGIYKVNQDNKKLDIDQNVEKPLAERYGAKMAKLVEICRQLMLSEDNRIIIFSSYDRMLQLISKTLKENGVSNSFVKGNVWQRNSAIKTFKKGANLMGDPSKVIMLSLENAASGTNLTEANHIIFVEPINKDKETIKSIEKQAIARACRIGQDKDVTVHRILTKETVEEEIFKSMYN